MAAHTGPGVTGNTASLNTSATAIFSPVSYKRTVIIQNVDSTNPVFIGGESTASLTTANGFRIAAGESFATDLPPFTEIYGIAGQATEIRYLALDGLD